MSDIKVAAKEALQTLWAAVCDAFQVKLVSGENIKTVNGNSLLGSGDLVVSGGGSYTLPPATSNTLGGIMVGDGLDVTSAGVLSTKYPKDDGDPDWTVYDLGPIDGVGYLKLATRTITGSLAVTNSYGGRYISALQTVDFPSDSISTVLYADVVAVSSPGIFHTAKTAISDTSIKYYVVANTSLTQAVTRRLFVVGIY